MAEIVLSVSLVYRRYVFLPSFIELQFGSFLCCLAQLHLPDFLSWSHMFARCVGLSELRVDLCR